MDLKAQFPRPITKLVCLGLGKSIADWPAMLYEHPELAGHEVWTVNSGGLTFKHDVVFDMHTEEYIYSQDTKQLKKILGRRKFLKTHDKPILMPRALPEYPTSVTYPLRLVVEQTRCNYFNNTGAYMMALAYLCGVRELIIFGMDYAAEKDDGSLYVENGRACVEYWLGRLTESGCLVVLTEGTRLMDSQSHSKTGAIYGYHLPLKVEPEGLHGVKFLGPTLEQLGAPKPEIIVEKTPKNKREKPNADK